MLLGLKAKLAAAGAVAMAVLAAVVRMQVLKNQRDRARDKAEILEARHHQVTLTRKIKREEERKLHSRRAELRKELEKDDDEFKGVNNLSNPNDF